MSKEVKCYKCGYKWNYTGKSKFFITCPRCMRKLLAKKVLK